MLVQKPRVPVPMAMRLAGRRVRRVFMLMMDVMYMAMFMLERFMQMLVVVRFSDVQINANTHQQRRAYESEGRCLTKQRERKGCTDEGSRREVSACACGSQMPKTQHKEHQADPIAKEADRACGGEYCEPRQ